MSDRGSSGSTDHLGLNLDDLDLSEVEGDDDGPSGPMDLTDDGNLSDHGEVPPPVDVEEIEVAPEAEAAPEGVVEGDAPSDDAAGGDRAGYSSCEEALEDAVSGLERVTAERDEYLDMARRVQAEFENYRRRVDQQRTEVAARAAESLVVELLPVLDGCDAALAHGATDVEPIHASLLVTLTKQGLEAIEAAEVPFDPNLHDAVLSEPSDGDDEMMVAEVMRTGYLWNGRVVRPAMVKVRG